MNFASALVHPTCPVSASPTSRTQLPSRANLLANNCPVLRINLKLKRMPGATKNTCCGSHPFNIVDHYLTYRG